MPQRLKWSLNSDIWLWCENDWTRTLCDSKKGEQVWETPQRLNQNCRTLVSHPASKIAPREISAHKLRLKLFQKTNSKTKWIHTFLDRVLVLFILSQWVVVFRKASIGCYRRHQRSLRAIIWGPSEIWLIEKDRDYPFKIHSRFQFKLSLIPIQSFLCKSFVGLGLFKSLVLWGKCRESEEQWRLCFHLSDTHTSHPSTPPQFLQRLKLVRLFCSSWN